MAGSQDMLIIVIMMMMMSSVFSVIVGGGLFLTLPQKGDECEGKDDNGYYVIDEDGKCVLDECDYGYSISSSGKKCIVDKIYDDDDDDDEDDDDDDTTTEYVYEFSVNVQNDSTLRLHLADIKMDGVRPTSDQVAMHVAPNRYECGNDNDEKLDCLGYIDAAGDTTWAAWDEKDGAVYGVGDKIFTVTSPTKVSSFEIAYQRPVYAPGWIIKENDVQVIKETTNRGNGTTPSPVTYTYTIP